MRFNSDHLNEMKNETSKDPVLNQLHEFIMSWPDSIKELSLAIHSSWSYKDELSVNDVILLKGTRILATENCLRPTSLQPSRHWEDTPSS